MVIAAIAALVDNGCFGPAPQSTPPIVYANTTARVTTSSTAKTRWTQIIVACPSTAIPAERKNTTTSAMTLPASPAPSQPSTGRSAATAKTPKTVLSASKATEVTQASAPLARLPRTPNAARVRVIVGSPARTPAIEAQPM